MRRSPLRGTKKSEACKQRMREGIKRAKERGVKFGGGKRRKPLLKFNCKQCQATFFSYNSKRVYCCRPCHMQGLRNRKKQVPELVAVELYLMGLSSIEIGRLFKVHYSIVTRALKEAGCPIRKSRCKRTMTCKEQGCSEPVLFVWRNVDQNWYGTQCEKHLKEYKAEWNRRHYLKKKESRQQASQIQAALCP